MEFKNITYKRQGDGRDSWAVETHDGQKYMTFEHPLKPLNISNVDISSLSDEQLEALYFLLEATRQRIESKGSSKMLRTSSTEESNTLSTRKVREAFAFKDPTPKTPYPWFKRLIHRLQRFFKRIFGIKS